MSENKTQKNNDEPVENPLFFDCQLDECQKMILLEKMKEARTAMDQYFGNDHRMDFDKWTFFNMLYGALCDQEALYNQKIRGEA